MGRRGGQRGASKTRWGKETGSQRLLYLRTQGGWLDPSCKRADFAKSHRRTIIMGVEAVWHPSKSSTASGPQDGQRGCSIEGAGEYMTKKSMCLGVRNTI